MQWRDRLGRWLKCRPRALCAWVRRLNPPVGDRCSSECRSGEQLTGHTGAVCGGRGASSAAGRCWPPAAATGRCGCGTRPPGTALGPPLTGHTGAGAWGAWGVVAGPAGAGHRRRRRDGAAVGPGSRRRRSETADRPHRPGGVGGVGAGRRPAGAGHRRRRRDRAAVGGDRGPAGAAAAAVPVRRDHACRSSWHRVADAVALAELVTAMSAQPPLAVGLFGDWGRARAISWSCWQQQVASGCPPG